MTRLLNEQRYGRGRPPGKDRFPVGERPNPKRPTVRVRAATWRGTGLWHWSDYPPAFTTSDGFEGRPPANGRGPYGITLDRGDGLEVEWIDRRKLARARVVAMTIGVRMDADGVAFPSLKSIAAESSFKADNIPGLVAVLEDLGFLFVNRGGGSQSNRYWATLPEGLHEALTRR